MDLTAAAARVPSLPSSQFQCHRRWWPGLAVISRVKAAAVDATSPPPVTPHGDRGDAVDAGDATETAGGQETINRALSS